MAALPFNHFFKNDCPIFMAEFHRSDFWMRFLEAILDAILERHSYN
jgi:hypothetical protein